MNDTVWVLRNPRPGVNETLSLDKTHIPQVRRIAKVGPHHGKWPDESYAAFAEVHVWKGEAHGLFDEVGTETLVGFIAAGIEDAVMRLWLSGVDPRFRGMGFGRRLYASMIALAGNMQLREVRYGVPEGNSPPSRIARSLGFVEDVWL